jgi:hypothetical protein
MTGLLHVLSNNSAERKPINGSFEPGSAGSRLLSGKAAATGFGTLLLSLISRRHDHHDLASQENRPLNRNLLKR